MRKILVIIAGGVVLGASGGVSSGWQVQHVRDLVASILEDVGSILYSFSGGPDDPNSPLNNPSTLNYDAARLEAATRKADQLASELKRLRNETPPR